MQSESIKELITALVKAQGEFSAIPKTSDNPFFKSKYASLPDVVMHTTPILSKNGLAVMQFVTYDDMGNDALITYLTHVSGEYIAYTMKLHLPKQDPQGQGSAITYARRYSYQAALGLVADEDDDGNAASKPTQQRQVTESKPSAPSKTPAPAGNQMITEGMAKMIWAITHKSLNWDDSKMFDYIDEASGRRIGDLKELTFAEAKSIIDKLKSLQDN
jgi:hypothetical protein